ncbi:hypothetical protein [Mycolicibacterium tusciae]|uniref:hypothetical protein n=1 Tax=Mycolicibacterium tusciae TaxID=75922 RepID=UPI001EF942BD|nr:hypothetical protein [Mycolicibacterium tusciae]
MLSAEIAAIRKRDPDLDPGDLTSFTFPLLVRLVGVLAVGVVPLVVIRSGGDTDSLLVPLGGSLALAIICTAVVAWLAAIVISGLVVMVFYRNPPRASSQLVARTLTESFERVSDATSHLMLLALVAGLISLAIGLPTRPSDDLANPVLDDLLAAQVAVLLAALGFAFVAESVRCAADIVDDQSLLLAWPWSLVIACLSWVLATAVGPFEITRMLTILLNEWLPAVVDGIPRAQVIADVLPPGARWWAALAPLPVIASIWAFEARRRDGFTHVREFLATYGSRYPAPPSPTARSLEKPKSSSSDGDR